MPSDVDIWGYPDEAAAGRDLTGYSIEAIDGSIGKVSTRPGMAQWRKRFFALISRNARNATAYFGIPPDRVVELGMQIKTGYIRPGVELFGVKLLGLTGETLRKAL